MLDAVGQVEDAGAEAAAREPQGVEEHRLALAVDGVRLFEEGGLADGAVGQRPGVLGQAEGGEGAVAAGEVDAEGGGPGDRQRGMAGVDVERREIEDEAGLGRDEQDTGDGLHAGQALPEGQADPGRGDARGQGQPPPADAQPRPPRDAGAPVHPQAERAGPALERRAREAGGDAPVASAGHRSDRDAQAAGHLGIGGGGGRVAGEAGEEGEFALRAADVGSAHGREAEAVEGFGREGDRDAQDGREDAVVAQQRPEGTALAEGDGVRAAAGVGGEARGGELGEAGAQVAGEEVVDTVLAGVDAGAEGRPGDRRHGRTTAAERGEGAVGAERGERGQPAGVHQARGAARIHAVEADDDDTPEAALRRAPEKGGEETDREGQQGQEAQGQGRDEDQEGAHHGKAGPRPDVGKRGWERQGREWGDYGHGRCCFTTKNTRGTKGGRGSRLNRVTRLNRFNRNG